MKNLNNTSGIPSSIGRTYVRHISQEELKKEFKDLYDKGWGRSLQSREMEDKKKKQEKNNG
jgi:hypothetical protein